MQQAPSPGTYFVFIILVMLLAGLIRAWGKRNRDKDIEPHLQVYLQNKLGNQPLSPGDNMLALIVSVIIIWWLFHMLGITGFQKF